jgi:hypothetical protein
VTSHLHLETFGPIHALPILHYRMEFAALVREAFRAVQPDCIALELPPTLEGPVLRAIRRLPEVSVMMYETAVAPLPGQKQGEPQTVYLLMEPADPLCEGARLGVEHDLPVAFVDLDLDHYPCHEEPFPDSYAVQRLGLAPYYQAFCQSKNSPPGQDDHRREQGMAWHLQQLSKKHRRILFICGMAHLERVKERYNLPQSRPLERIRRDGVRIMNLHPDSCRELLGEAPFLTALHELHRGELPPEPAPTASLRRSFGAFELLAGGKKEIPEQEALREALHRSARHVMDPSGMIDRQRVLFRLFQEVSRHYRQESGEPVHLWQRRAFFRYVRNLALVDGMLMPDLFSQLAAARGCLDDTFAHAWWRLATFSPWQREEAEIPTIRLHPEDLQSGRRVIRFRPRPLREGRKGLSMLPFLKRKGEKRPGEWLAGFDTPSLCSFPPEDLVIEQYGTFLKKKGNSQLSQEQSRTEPFTTSLLDGIDLRETLRNLHEGRIYVRENGKVKGGVGGVVVIFDEDQGGKKFPYLMTWLGEHAQESDMAFYSTLPEEHVVGPGICRCDYGGLLLSSPPRRLQDIWRDPDYAFARTKGERLLLAALDYSREKHVVYVAAHPPRSIFRQIASRLERKIVHIPIGSLSPVKLKKIRVFHVLFGHDKREIAREYVW